MSALNNYFSDENPQPELDMTGFRHTPQFVRETTFEEDLINLKNKYTKGSGKGNHAVYVQHMIDSLIIFRHNAQHYGMIPEPYLDQVLEDLKK